MGFQKLIIILTNVPILVAAVYAFKHYRNFNMELKAISWFVFFSVLIQFPSLTLSFLGINNMPLLHIYVPTAFILLALFFYYVCKDYINKRVFLYMTVLFVLYTISNSLFLQDIFTFNSYALTVKSILVTIFSLFTYILILNKSVKAIKQQQHSSLIWINSGLFLYFSSSLLLFYFGELLTSFTTFQFRINWMFHSFLYIIMFSCIIKGLWSYPKN